MSLALALVLALQSPQQSQAPDAAPAAAPLVQPPTRGRGIAGLRQRVAPVRGTTPPGDDTTRYWQQRIRYTVRATLEEGPGVLHAAGTLVYVNQSPDTLRELWVHQYLNAFRPGSRWSATDAAEGRVRFQRLADPDYGYERFTAPATFDGVRAAAEYPGAPDSTVARFRLPRALAPNESVTVAFRWDARPSTVPRRQARRGRSFDFAQWFPKPAVYDRGGWEPHAFAPAGELYGEFGDYDVTLVVRRDQVIGATGVPVSGDPGWGTGAGAYAARPAAGAYGAPGAAASVATASEPVPDGYKAVRFVARDVHHFAFSLAPDYRYEGGVYVRRAGVGAGRLTPWDTVSIHVLYRPRDVAEWGGGQTVERTRRALAWLESRYGTYAYPQMTVLHRIDGGGTEFPMMQMNGSSSQGLILHEGGHVFSYGILANNEWRSGWMDEGLTEYQTEWAQGLTRPERGRGQVPLADVVGVTAAAPGANARAAAFAATVTPPRPAGYAGLAVRPPAAEEGALGQYALDLAGRAQPIGLQSEYFRDFGTYNAMIYNRAAMMYGQLRDATGDSTFTRFLRTYYARWALRHVDEPAMRSSAEAAAGRDLGWFFDQWVHRTGLIDYSLDRVRVARDGAGWVTRARVRRRGAYRHPMPVGVRTATGWTVVRADALPDAQEVVLRTADEPIDVTLDPQHTTEDWYRPNDGWRRRRWWTLVPARPDVQRWVVDWPFLQQADADRYLTEVRPMAWTSAPNRALLGARLRGNYQGVADRSEVGIVFATRGADGLAGEPALQSPNGRVQAWLSMEDPYFRGRTLRGLRYGVWSLDGVSKVEVAKAWNASPYTYSAGPQETTAVAFTGTYAYSRALVDPARWSGGDVSEVRGTFGRHTRGDVAYGVNATAGLGVASHLPGADARAYARGELALTRTARQGGGRATGFARAYAAAAPRAPLERRPYASADDPTSTFENHFWRPRGGLLAPRSVESDGERRTLADGHYRPLGGAALRGYDPLLPLSSVAAANVEEAVRLVSALPFARTLSVHASIFADAGLARLDGPERPTTRTLADAGPALLLRGKLYDQAVRARLDFPLYVRTAGAGVGDRGAGGTSRFRVAFSFNDLW